MNAADIPIGCTATRKSWGKQLSLINLCGEIRYTGTGKLLKENSHVWDHTDFYIINKDFTMPKQTSYTDATITVQASDGTLYSYATEEEAYEDIQNQLETSPKVRFKMFKVYQSIEPQRIDITSMIKTIE